MTPFWVFGERELEWLRGTERRRVCSEFRMLEGSTPGVFLRESGPLSLGFFICKMERAPSLATLPE